MVADIWKIEDRKVGDLIPYKANPRKISPERLEKLKQRIESQGIRVPPSIAIDGTILAGHQRIKAIIDLYGTDTIIPVALANRELSEKEVQEIVASDNLSWGEFDWDILANEFDLDKLREWGFTDKDLKFKIKDTEVVEGEDDAPEAPVNPVTKPGDIWLLGKHKLICGDATNLADIERLMGGGKADMVFTDPPYNVDYQGRGANKLGKIKNDSMGDNDFEQFLRDIFASTAAAMKPLACIYVCHTDSQSAPKLAFEKTFSEVFKKSSTIIWMKQSAGIGWQDYRSQHEPILYGWKEASGKHFFCGDRSKTTVWDIGRDAQSTYQHPTQKPVALPQEAINNSSKGEDIILDPFGGSGSTLIACEKLGRFARLSELDPKYCDVIVKRWQTFTGNKATLESSGQLFDELDKPVI